MTNPQSGRQDAAQYRNSGNLRMRGNLHARYANKNWFEWVADHLDLSPGSDVIDIGCGHGLFWTSAARHLPKDLRLTLVDSSESMVAEAEQSVSAIGAFGAINGHVADATALPFADCAFDCVVAMHMLYHVPNCVLALGEFARILRPGGKAIVTTNGDNNLRQLFDLGQQVLGGTSIDPAAQAFGIAYANSLLAQRFGRVAVHRFEDTYSIDDAAGVYHYLTSFPPGAHANETERSQLRRLIEGHLRRSGGVLRVTREAGLIRATARL